MTKEPGQLAFELDQSNIAPEGRDRWDDLLPWAKKHWAAVELAIRADEAAKERERCARIAEGNFIQDGLWSLNCEYWDRDSSYGKGRLDAAAAIRESKDG